MISSVLKNVSWKLVARVCSIVLGPPIIIKAINNILISKEFKKIREENQIREETRIIQEAFRKEIQECLNSLAIENNKHREKMMEVFLKLSQSEIKKT